MISGDLLKRIRLASGKSQKDIAELTGVSVRTIGAIERFEVRPTQELYDKYINAVYTDEKPVVKATPKKRGTKSKAE